MQRMHHRMVGPLRTVCRTNLNLVKYTRLLAAPEPDASRMVTAGQSRRSRLSSRIQEKLSDSSSRLAGDADPVSHIHDGGQQHPSPLARWSLRMTARSRLGREGTCSWIQMALGAARQELVALTPNHLPFAFLV